MGPKSTGSVIRRAGKTHRDAEKKAMGRWSRDWSDASTGHKMPRIHRPPEARREGWDGFFLKVSRKNQSCQLLNFLLPASKTEREYISIVSSFPVGAHCDMEILEN